MMGMVRIRIRILLFCFGAVCAFFATVSLSMGQQTDLPSNGIPYRRVFVPSKDLVHIGLDDFSPIDVKQLEELIRRHSTSRQPAPTNEIASDTTGKIQLQSAYFVAKLVGPDLFSERSQLTLAGSPRPGERVSLRPWSLAVQLPITQGNWIFDEQGAPRIATLPSDQVRSEGEFYQRQYSYSFGWSARADSASTPNNLKFIFEIPKCANSCLVLALPPQAIVQDCLTVARRLDGWSEVESRLKGWRDMDKEYLLERSPSRSPESLWLIELGGSQSVSFSIALGVGNRPQDDTNGLDAHRYRQLIRVQNLEHVVDGQQIRTTCEAEVFVSPEQPWLRMSLEPGSRLRRLTVNQQEVDWKLDDGWIQWSVGPAIKGAATSKSVSVVAEFISPLSLEKLGKTETPRVSFDHGYVMSGTTVVHSQFPWRLTNVECESSRIAEPTGDSKSTGVNRLEYAWYANPPSLSIGLERSTQARRCEVLTRLTNDEQSMLAVIRAKLFFGEQDSNQTKLTIAPGWSVRSIHSVDPSDSVTTQYDVETIATASELRLSWDRVQKSRVAELEIRLVRNLEESSGQQRRIRNAEIVQLVDWKRNDTLVLEDSGQFELKLCDALLDDLVTVESIPDWQKSLLPRTGKYYVFRLDSQAPNPSINKVPKTTQERDSDTLLVDFFWDTKPYRRQASTKTEVDRISGTALQARHEIQLSLNSNRSESVSIGLPSDNVIWRLKEGSKWIPLSPLEASPEQNKLGSGVWHFDLGQKASECTLLAVVHSEIENDGEVRFPIPKLLNADMLAQEARSLATDVSIESRTVHSTWSIDEAGYKFLKFNDASGDASGDANIVLTAKVSPPSPLRKWFVIASEYHVAVDSFGSQKASLYFRSNATNQSPFVMELDNDWEPLTVGIRRSSIVQQIPFRIDGRRLVITPELRDLDGEVELHIDLTGPRLSKKSSIQAMGEYFPFRWPDLAMDATCVSQQRFLWLPIEMQLAELGNKPGVPGQGKWPMWNWSRDVIALLFGYSFSQDSVISSKDGRPSSGLVPQWTAKGWRVMRMNSPTLDARSFVGTKSDHGVFSIHRADIDRSYLVMLFAVARSSTSCRASPAAARCCSTIPAGPSPSTTGSTG